MSKLINELDQLMLMSNSFTRMPNYFRYVIKMGKEIDPKIYWEYLGEAYVGSDGNHKGMPIIKQMFLKDLPFREHLMTPEEREYLAALPEEITIYRGCSVLESEGKYHGISWSLNEAKAKFFAFEEIRNRYRKNQRNTVIQKTVSKSDVVAYFNRREEEEIIYIPNH